MNKTIELFFYPLLALAMLFVVSQGCCGSGSNVGEKVGTKAPQGPAATPKVETYKAGDIVQVKNHSIALNEAKVQGGTLIANFTVENQGPDEITVSSLASFSARDEEGSKLNFSLCEGSQLDGKVLAGDKLRGNLCWSGVKGTKGVKIYYEPTLFGSGAIVWELD